MKKNLENFVEKGCLLIFDDCEIETFSKHSGLPAFLPFFHNVMSLITFDLLTTSAFNFDQVKILSFGKELKTCPSKATNFSRGERRKYTKKKVCLNQGWNPQPPCSPLSHLGGAKVTGISFENKGQQSERKRPRKDLNQPPTSTV